MSKLIVAALSVLVFTFVGCTPAAVDPVGEACYWLTSSEVDAVYSMVRIDRSNGFTYQEEVAVAIDVCGTYPDAMGCNGCFIAIVDDVYGVR